MKKKITLAITLGDPSGVGPELVVKALANKKVKSVCECIVVGSEQVISNRVKKLGLVPIKNKIIDNSNLRSIPPIGRISASAGRASMQWVEQGVNLVKQGVADAIVTGPINKVAIHKGGYDVPGHTEFIAGLLKSNGSEVMMLVAGNMRVALVTTHIPYKDVPASITGRAISRIIRTTDEALKNLWGIKKPRIGVLALNPHASDNGLFGNEERAVITPTIKRLQKQGFLLEGPMVPDVAFRRKNIDAFVCMYHDQGLIPLKLMSFGRGVNVTLGLPIIRTSPDHGTAFDIAGKGIADEGAFVEAILLAAKNAKCKKVSLI